MKSTRTRKEEVMRRNRRRKKSSDRNQVRHTLHSGKQPEWMWARKGSMTNIVADVRGDGTIERVLPLFFTYEDARHAITPELWESGVRPAKIGALPPDADGNRETLETVLATASLADGCTYCMVTVQRNDEGGDLVEFRDIRWQRLLGLRK